MNTSFGRSWTAAEDAVIRRRHASPMRAADLAKLLCRSKAAVDQRTRRLGVQISRKWTAADDARLGALWGLLSTRQIAHRLKRTTAAVYLRARTNGLARAERESKETLSESARRTGYTRQWLIRILARAGVVTVAISRCSSRYKMRNAYLLEKDEVDEAIRAWVTRESVGAAARRYDTTPERLVTALKRIGVTRPGDLPPRKQWRLDDATIERALSVRRAA